MLQIVLTMILYLLLLIPVGNYVYRIAAGKHTFADPVMDRVDHAIYKLCGVNPERSMDWKLSLIHILSGCVACDACKQMADIVCVRMSRML